MANRSKIPWTDYTSNPIKGCFPISPGCKNCYAVNMAWRLHCMGVEGYETVVEPAGHKGSKWTGKQEFVESELDSIAKIKKPSKIFVGSMCDLFMDVNIESAQWLKKIWLMMRDNPQHTFQILTKRPENIQGFFDYMHESEDWFDASLPNIWLGVSVCTQKEADEKVPTLMECPAPVRFVSVEPMLESIKLNWSCCNYKLSLVICGAETGPRARYMNPEWAISLKNQCKAAGVPFFMKEMSKRDLKPEELRVRQWPKGYEA